MVEILHSGRKPSIYTFIYFSSFFVVVVGMYAFLHLFTGVCVGFFFLFLFFCCFIFHFDNRRAPYSTSPALPHL